MTQSNTQDPTACLLYTSVRHVNYGLTDAHKLGRQLARLQEEEPQITPITQISRNESVKSV